MAIALFWGFAEATLFFIVPDVFLSWLTLVRGLRSGLRASLTASLGAVLGGGVMATWALHDPAGAQQLVDQIPNISMTLIDDARRSYSSEGVLAMVTGAFRGVPYKIYAVLAGQAGLAASLWLLAATVPARLLRFVAVVFAVHGLSSVLHRLGLSRLIMLILLAGFWLCFYGWYFVVMPE